MTDFNFHCVDGSCQISAIIANIESVFVLLLNREEDTENENEKKIWYYSTKVQLAELIDCLDKDYWEAELCKILEEMREEIHRHMDITEDLTNKARGSNKSFLAAANGKREIFSFYLLLNLR